MRTLDVGSWLNKKEVALVKKKLIEDFDDENVSCEDKAQYLDSILAFSLMRGLSKKNLIESSEFALRNEEYNPKKCNVAFEYDEEKENI